MNKFQRKETKSERMWGAVAIGIFISMLVCGMLAGCQTPPERMAYNTLFSLEKATISAYDTYLDGVIAGKIKTNGVPQVSKAFNTFQESMTTALVLSDWNKLARPSDQIILSAKTVTAVIKANK